jgi:hypothetical protein
MKRHLQRKVLPDLLTVVQISIYLTLFFKPKVHICAGEELGIRSHIFCASSNQLPPILNPKFLCRIPTTGIFGKYSY